MYTGLGHNYGYIILWRGKRYEYSTNDPAIGTYLARELFCSDHNIKPSRRHEVTVLLAEKNGEPVVHSTVGL